MNCAGSGWTWAGNCRVMCMTEYLTRKNATDTFFFSSDMQTTGGTFQAFVCFLNTSFGGESPRLGIALKLRPKLRPVREG